MGGTLIFHTTFVGPGHFIWFKILNFSISFFFSGGGGYEDFVDIFLVSSQNWTKLGVISLHLGSFFKVKVQCGGYFLRLIKFQIIFLGA